jgi:hypothetical protein
MPLMEKIDTYSVSVAQNNFLDYYRTIRLSLDSGETAFIAFPKVRPQNWLEITAAYTNLYMTADEFGDVYHLLQTENPVFFTALKVLGLEAAAVHTELDLSVGEPTGEGDEDPRSLEALILRARERVDVSGSSAPAATG